MLQVEAYERLAAEGESVKAFEAYKLYRDTGTGRLIKAVWEQLYGLQRGYSRRTVDGWSAKFRWRERAASKDVYINSIKQKAIADHAQEKGYQMAERQERLQEGRLEAREMALDQVKRMLRFPLTEEVAKRQTEDGETTIVIRPAGWNKNTVRSMYAVASDDKLERKIQETARQFTEELDDTPDGDENEPIGINDLTPEERMMLMEELGMISDETSGDE